MLIRDIRASPPQRKPAAERPQRPDPEGFSGFALRCVALRRLTSRRLAWIAARFGPWTLTPVGRSVTRLSAREAPTRAIRKQDNRPHRRQSSSRADLPGNPRLLAKISHQRTPVSHPEASNGHPRSHRGAHRKAKGARVPARGAPHCLLSLRGLTKGIAWIGYYPAAFVAIANPRARTIIAAVSPFDFQCQSFSG
jgi:hypothetical protein